MTHTELIKTLPNYIASSIDVHFPADSRSTTSAALADIGLEHYRSISKLITANHYGSASALMRPLFEVTVLSIWIYFSATDSELEKFEDGKQLLSRSKTRKSDNKAMPKTFDEYVKELKGIPEMQSELIQFDKDSTWRVLNSFTHGGLHAMARRFNGDSFKPNYPPETVEQIAKFCNRYAAFTLGQITTISKSDTLKQILEEVYRRLSDITNVQDESS